MQRYNKLIERIKPYSAAEKLDVLLEFGKDNKAKHPDEALLALEDAAVIAQKLDHKKKYVKSNNLAIDCHFSKENFEVADSLFHEMLSYIWKHSIDITDWMFSNQHAYRYYLYGNYNKALHFFQKSLSLTDKIEDKNILLEYYVISVRFLLKWEIFQQLISSLKKA